MCHLVLRSARKAGHRLSPRLAPAAGWARVSPTSFPSFPAPSLCSWFTEALHPGSLAGRGSAGPTRAACLRSRTAEHRPALGAEAVGGERLLEGHAMTGCSRLRGYVGTAAPQLTGCVLLCLTGTRNRNTA